MPRRPVRACRTAASRDEVVAPSRRAERERGPRWHPRAGSAAARMGGGPQAVFDVDRPRQGRGRLHPGQRRTAGAEPRGAGAVHAVRRHRAARALRYCRSRAAHAVVIGRSDIVGKPMALLLLHRHATVTICHSKTADLPAITRQADILVAAVGRTAFVRPEYVKPGATVIDVGINRVTDRAEVDALFPERSTRRADFEKRGALVVGDVHPDGRRGGRRADARAWRCRTADDRVAPSQHSDGRRAPRAVTRVALTGGIARARATCCAHWPGAACRRSTPTGLRTTSSHRLRRLPPLSGTLWQQKSSTTDGGVDRRALGAIVFNDPDARRALEEIVHPAVYEAIDRWFASLPAGTSSAVADIPLLYETGHDSDFDVVVVAACLAGGAVAPRHGARSAVERRGVCADRRAVAARRESTSRRPRDLDDWQRRRDRTADDRCSRRSGTQAQALAWAS